MPLPRGPGELCTEFLPVMSEAKVTWDGKEAFLNNQRQFGGAGASWGSAGVVDSAL